MEATLFQTFLFQTEKTAETVIIARAPCLVLFTVHLYLIPFISIRIPNLFTYLSIAFEMHVFYILILQNIHLYHIAITKISV